jgi:hypothetical protein
MTSTDLLERIANARASALTWLVDHVESDGRPIDCEERTGWPRLGWGLVVGGRSDIAAKTVAWLCHNRIAPEGGFQSGRMNGQGYISSYPNYWLGTFAMSAWFAGLSRQAMNTMDFLTSQQDQETGGLPMAGSRSAAQPVCDVLSTAQVGLAALVLGEHQVAHRAAMWVRRLAEQDASKSLVFHACMQGNGLWTQPDTIHAWASINDFSEPRQAFYPPAMGAVFLARHAARFDCVESLASARRLLAFNILGTAAQFEDIESVQACKFGWAVAEMHHADPGGDWMSWVVRMSEWFLDRQDPEGWWGPSKFADPAPSVADRMIKTAEHLMELTALSTALGASRST